MACTAFVVRLFNEQLPVQFVWNKNLTNETKISVEHSRHTSET